MSRSRVFDMVERFTGAEPGRAHRRRAQRLGLRPAAPDHRQATTRRPGADRSAWRSSVRPCRRRRPTRARRARRCSAETPKTRPHLKYPRRPVRGYVVLDVTRGAAAGRLVAACRRSTSARPSSASPRDWCARPAAATWPTPPRRWRRPPVPTRPRRSEARPGSRVTGATGRRPAVRSCMRLSGRNDSRSACISVTRLHGRRAVPV